MLDARQYQRLDEGVPGSSDDEGVQHACTSGECSYDLRDDKPRSLLYCSICPGVFVPGTVAGRVDGSVHISAQTAK